MRCVGYLMAALCGLCFLSSEVGAKQRKDVFGDANRIQGWIGTYREDPRPGRA